MSRRSSAPAPPRPRHLKPRLLRAYAAGLATSRCRLRVEDLVGAAMAPALLLLHLLAAAAGVAVAPSPCGGAMPSPRISPTSPRLQVWLPLPLLAAAGVALSPRGCASHPSSRPPQQVPLPLPLVAAAAAPAPSRRSGGASCFPSLRRRRLPPLFAAAAAQGGRGRGEVLPRPHRCRRGERSGTGA
ncbi:hypothetical protein U9M48_026951 [Paspalum notatum var. saurae]|uniref:Uncharacterized protein n=1 Tax=Paspalum notatum var. saurae TaxID=547442 RepID=A0AAQ3TYH5_PASNO